MTELRLQQYAKWSELILIEMNQNCVNGNVRLAQNLEN